MTNRQFVLQYYPMAEIRYIVRVQNTLSPQSYYLIRSGGIDSNFETKIIGRGKTSLLAWRDAKKNITNDLKTKI